MATPAQAAKLEAKAQAEENKSAGLRMLFEAGYTVAEARTVLDVPYGFAYGVAKRAGVVETAAQRRGDGSATAARKAKAAPAPAKATKATAKAAPRTVKAPAKTTAKAKATRK